MTRTWCADPHMSQYYGDADLNLNMVIIELLRVLVVQGRGFARIPYFKFLFFHTCSYLCIFRDPSYALTYIYQSSLAEKIWLVQRSEIFAVPINFFQTLINSEEYF